MRWASTVVLPKSELRTRTRASRWIKFGGGYHEGFSLEPVVLVLNQKLTDLRRSLRTYPINSSLQLA